MYLDFVSIGAWNVAVTICNTLITFAIIKHFLFKPVRKVLADREQAVKTLYEQAENDREQAEKMKQDYAITLSHAKEEATEIVNAAKQRGDKKAVEIIDQASTQAMEMKEKANASIVQERKAAMNQMKDEIAEMSLLIAEKVVEREINADDHTRMMQDFIEKVG